MPAFSPRGYKNPATTGEINDPAFWKTVGENQDARFLEAKASADLVSGEAAAATAKANEAKAVADFASQRAAGAVANAVDAKQAAQQARDEAVTTAEDASTRVDALEVMGGVQPGSVNDANMALHTQQDGLFKAALNDQIAQVSHNDQNDMVTLIRANSPQYVSAKFVKVAADKYQCRFHDGTKGITYQFAKDTLDDFHKIDGCYVGMGQAVDSFHVPTSEDLTGTWSTGTASWYTTVPGATFTFTVAGGSSVGLRIIAESRGGLFSVSVDGGPPVDMSCWSAAQVDKIITVATGLDPGVPHTIVGTYMGDDPARAPSSSPSRGYVRHSTEGTALGYVIDAAPLQMVLADGSNKEFAFSVQVGADYNWVPDHGAGSAFNITAPIFTVDGVTLDAESMVVGEAVPITDAFEMRQHFHGRIAATGANIMEFHTTHRVDPQGLLSFSGRWTALASVLVGAGYPLMLPAREPDTSEFVTGIGNRQTNNASDAEVAFPEDRDAVYSGAVVSPTNRNLIAAGTLTNPRMSYRRGKDYRREQNDRLFVWHRATKPKMYWSAMQGWPVAPGDTYGWGFTMAIGDLDGIYDLATA